jgi:two-component system, LytTR family, sensor kinase
MNSYRRVYLTLVHVLLWGVFIVIPKFFLPSQIRIDLSDELLLWLPIIAFFYLNYFILVPQFLTKKKFSLYLIIIFSLVVISAILGEISAPVFHHSIPSYRDALIPPNGLRNLTSCFLFLALGTSIRVTEQWFSNEKQRKEMETQKLAAELSFLKSQINPHFFFNTLNSIYSLAISKSDKTPEAIIKLSELMRFIIYESEKDMVPLRRELEYINNYVELQKLRLMSNISVRYHVEGDINHKRIEPLLLLPFIENAFKHGIDATKNCVIGIKVKISVTDLMLIVENPVVKPSMKEDRENPGIGLANSKKRLELIYGEKHTLNISQTGNIFKIELNINFKNDELHNS